MDTDDVKDDVVVFIEKIITVVICGLLQNGTGDASILENACSGYFHIAVTKNNRSCEAID